MFNPSRDQARRHFMEAWRKHREHGLLDGMEHLAVTHIQAHPEYHAIMEDEASLERDWLPEMGESNPFLHLALHIAISEQLSIDQPAGIKAAYASLRARLGDEHATQHTVMECLAEMIWQSQRHATPPDGAAYVRCVEAAARR